MAKPIARKVAVKVLDREAVIEAVHGLKYSTYNSLYEVVAEFKWQGKIERDYANDIQDIGALSGDRSWLALVGVKCDTEWLEEWLTRYETGTWIVTFWYEEDDGYWIISRQR